MIAAKGACFCAAQDKQNGKTNGKRRFEYKGEDYSGVYNLHWKDSDNRKEIFLRREHPLCQSLLEESNRGKLNLAKLVFNYTNDGTTESYYRFVTRKEAQKVEIDKVVNGQVTNLFSNYLSAGYGTGSEYLFKVVLVGNEAYCYSYYQ